MAQLLEPRDGRPAPGTIAARPRYARTGDDARKLSREERLERKLALARWERDRWQRRCLLARQRVEALERRAAWVESYLGFRLEYRARGVWRRLNRLRRIALRRVRWFVQNRPTWIAYPLMLATCRVLGHLPCYQCRKRDAPCHWCARCCNTVEKPTA